MKFAKAFGLGAALASAAIATSPAAATLIDFQIDGATVTDTGKPQTIQISDDLYVNVYAWNANPTTNRSGTVTGYDVTTAQVGRWAGGLGVISNYDDVGCGTGGCNQHQIDNLGDDPNSHSYDFLQLVFTDKAGNAKAVNINTLERTAWSTANAAITKYVYDDDFSIGSGATLSSSLSSLTTLFSQNYGANGACTAKTTAVPGGTAKICDDTTTITGIAASANWYIGAAIGPSSYGADNIVDGFKLASLDVTAVNTAPVPEPASWGMMILGFGFTGTAMRRRKAKVVFVEG